MTGYLIIDFDSTFVAGEAFDELADIVLAEAPDREQRVAEIAEITKAGMEGRIGFDESLERRIGALQPREQDLRKLVEALRARVTPSVADARAWIRANADRIYVISGGFREFVVPVVKDFGIAPDHVLANKFEWKNGHATGVDSSNPLAHSDGKPAVLKELELDEPAVMVGDALSDYAPREQGVADGFVAFIENVKRPGVAEVADAVAENFGEVRAFVDEMVVSPDQSVLNRGHS